MEYLRNPAWGRAEEDMEQRATISGQSRENPGRSHAMLLLNPPDHTRIRSLVARAFTPKRIEALRPRITEMLDPILDEVASAGTVDIMSTLAIPYPVAVISALLGVPEDPTGRFATLVRDSTSFIDAAATKESLAAGEAAIIELAAFFVDLIEQRRREPDDALLSALIEVEEAGDRLSLEELVANSILMYAAGFETTSNLIGNGLWALLRHPDQMALLRSRPELMSSAIWEILRFDSPVQLNARFALTDTTLFGREVGRGEQVVILQGAGNHDPLVYDHPERFDVARFENDGAPTPLSFGWGAHHCLGAHLARAEGEVVFAGLLDRFASIEHVGEEPHYRPSFTLRGLDALTVKVTPR
jgi:cytochrome P450